MGDPWTIVPYNDPYDYPIPENILDFQHHHFSLLPDPLSSNNNRHNNDNNNNNPSPSFPQHSNAIFQSVNNDLNSGHHHQAVIHDTPMCEQLPHQSGNFEAGPSQIHGDNHRQEINNNHNNINYNNVHSLNFPEATQITQWPDQPAPFLCSCCQILREVIHTNGIQFVKLEIHGTLGVIFHAILRHNINAGSSGDQQTTMLDFSSFSMEGIKNFMKQYCAEKNAAGCFTLPDPLSGYYEALCVGMEWNEDLNDELLDTFTDNNGGPSDDTEDPMDKADKASLAIQRERAGKMKLSDFSDVFHLPIEDAAKHVNLCPTVVKKICRKQGLPRWPHRKIKSIMRKVNILRGSLNSAEAASRAQTEAEIQRLHEEIVEHCGGIVPTSLNFNA